MVSMEILAKLVVSASSLGLAPGETDSESFAKICICHQTRRNKRQLQVHADAAGLPAAAACCSVLRRDRFGSADQSGSMTMTVHRQIEAGFELSIVL